MDCLFARQGVKLNNIKFFRGTEYSISEDRFHEELCGSLDRVASERAVLSDAPPKCAKQRLDLREMVAQM